jgi:hypothetical protein
MLPRSCLGRRRALKVEYLGEYKSIFVTALDHKSDFVGFFDKKRGKNYHAAVPLSFYTQMTSSFPHANIHGL